MPPRCAKTDAGKDTAKVAMKAHQGFLARIGIGVSASKKFAFSPSGLSI
jgi:hypothetical protein